MSAHEIRLPADRPLVARPHRSAGAVRQIAASAVLTLALSLPQGLLALPIAVAQVGLRTGLSILALVGLLNIVTVAWTARHVALGGAKSLPALAAERLGPWGRYLALGGSAGLFFLALVASLVGLARSLAGLIGAPEPALGLICGLAVMALTAGGLALSTRLLIGLGCCNLGLLVALLLLAAPAAGPLERPAGAGSPGLMLGVSLMLFFAPMLVPAVAQQLGPTGPSRPAFVLGSAAGVAASVGLALLWALVVSGLGQAAQLAGAAGTAIPALIAAVPVATPLALLLELLLLGMTALRCALVLRGLAEEQLARRRSPVVHLPGGLALALAIAVLISGAASFTLLIAVAGGVAATVISLVIPTLLAWAGAGDGEAPGR